MKYDIVKLMARRKIRWKKRWVSGDSGGRLTFRSKKAGRLSDYRIYGNTVGGESVGDLVESGEHAGEYEVPVTVEGKNLLPNAATSQTINGVTFTANDDGSVTCNGTASTTVLYLVSSKAFSLPVGNYKLNGAPIGGELTNNFKLDVRVSSNVYYPDTGNGISFNILQGETIIMCRIVIYSGYTCDNLTFYPMIRKSDIEDDTYEPYHAPVTTPIYLPEQIRKVGDDAEYIDYAEQKLHRVRKNLLPNTATSQTRNGVTFTVNGDGSVTCNTDENGATATTSLVICMTPDIPESTNLILSGCPEGGSVLTYAIQYSNWVDNARSDTGSGISFTKYDYETYPAARVAIRIYEGCVSNNLTFYPMIRKADIEDDTYEPYIENTDLDVTLPALPVLPGTNVLSVGTEVQPSRVEVKGRIKPEAAEPEPEAAEPEPEAAEPEPEAAEPEPETAEAEQETAEPEPETAEAEQE